MAQFTIGIISGAGPGAAKAAAAAKKAGHRVVFITISEAGGDPVEIADQNFSLSLTKVGDIIQTLQSTGCTGVLLTGKFDKGLHNLDLSEMDDIALELLQSLPGRADMDIGKVVVDFLESKGIPPISQLEAFAESVAPSGHIAGPPDDGARDNDVQLGLKVARTVAGFDIGQTVVIKQGLVVAIEAAEHSDQCINRAGDLIQGPKVVVKVARPDQDFRFDTPAVGNETLDAMEKAGADLLALEAGRTLILDEDFADTANRMGITVIGLESE